MGLESTSLQSPELLRVDYVDSAGMGRRLVFLKEKSAEVIVVVVTNRAGAGGTTQRSYKTWKALNVKLLQMFLAGVQPYIKRSRINWCTSVVFILNKPQYANGTYLDERGTHLIAYRW
jgi:hypothetical protein